MSRHLPTPRLAGALVLAALMGWGAPTALAVDPPGGPATSPSSPSRSSSWTFSWSAPALAEGFAITGYEGGIDGAAGSFGLSESVTLTVPEGAHTFQVRATATDGTTVDTSAFATVGVRVDTQGPTITPSFPQPNGLRGWYVREFTVSFSCSDPSGVASCGPNRTFARSAENQGAHGVTATASDSLGNTSALTAGPFNIDMLVPPEALLSTPGVGAVTAVEPTFTWARNTSRETSGYERYEVQVLINGAWRRVASVPYPPNPPATFSGARNPALWAPAFPERTPLQWRVTTFDQAGNSKASVTRTFTIDSSAPAKPTIVLGPSGPVRGTTPTFSWSGTEPTFTWSVSREGAEAPAQAGSGPATTAGLAALADGDYVFSVSQVSAAGVTGVEATRAFTIDTVAPPPPTITARPTSPTTVPTPAYAWSGEPENTFRWQVVTSAGASAQSPTETALTSATLAPLVPGGYAFRVSQIDAAGNVSGAATDALTISGPAIAAPAAVVVARLPSLRASRLSPKANRTLMTRRPNLSWKRGPAGTTLYNVQVFKVGPKGSPSKKLVKVFSGFPRARHLRAPKGKLRPGMCYVWRVWPYVKTGFTREPLGVSNFCVGSAKQLKAAARRGRA